MKFHLRAELGGKPIVVLRTPSDRHEQPVLPLLMECGGVKRRGRPRIRSDRLVGDQGSSSPTVRRDLNGRGIGALLPTKADQEPLPTFDRAAYRERNAIERLFNRLTQQRRVAPGYEKRAANARAMVTREAILLAPRVVTTEPQRRDYGPRRPGV